MSEKRPSEPVKKTTHRMRGFILYVALLLAVFLRGFVPRWLKSRRCSCRLSEAERQSQPGQDAEHPCLRGHRCAAGRL